MKHSHEDTKKIISGLLIGAVGAGALYCLYAAKHRKTPVLKKIGQTIVEVGEMIENCNLNSVTKVAESIEHKLPEGKEVLNSLSDWVSAGISIWKKLK